MHPEFQTQPCFLRTSSVLRDVHLIGIKTLQGWRNASKKSNQRKSYKNRATVLLYMSGFIPSLLFYFRENGVFSRWNVDPLAVAVLGQGSSWLHWAPPSCQRSRASPRRNFPTETSNCPTKNPKKETPCEVEKSHQRLALGPPLLKKLLSENHRFTNEARDGPGCL